MEALVSFGILGTGAMAVLSLGLTVIRADETVRARDRVLAVIEDVQQELRNYVTADASSATREQDPGGDGRWHIPGDSCAQHALSTDCEHDITARLRSQAPEFLAKHSQAKLLYRVSLDGGEGARRVDFTLDW